MISSQYNGNGYLIFVNDKEIRLNQDEINEFQSYDFVNNKYDEFTYSELQVKLEDSEIDHTDTINMANRDFEDLQLKIDRLTDKYEDSDIFEELTELGEYCNMLSERYEA
jgi:hypothetical protein